MAWAQIVQQPRVGWAVCLDLLFPPRCAFCQADTGGREREPAEGRPAAFCAVCFHELTADGGRCLQCGGRHGRGQPCRGGRQAADWDGLAVLGGYGDRLREAVLRCKRPPGEFLARGLADALIAVHGTTFRAWGIDRVVPVPMHWCRRALRGTSAADEIAQAVAAGLHVWCERSLRRRHATRMQNELPVGERRANVQDAFALRRSVRGRRVLLVDDVCTTGATLAACRRLLSAGGAAAVYAAVVARAEPASSDDAPEPPDAVDG
jgi:ComF family protein